MTTNLGDIATWTSAAISLVSVAVAISAIKTASKSGAKAEALSEQNASLMELQTKLNHQAWADEYFRDVTAWATNASLWISRATHGNLKGDDYLDEKPEILAQLSASIDTGRWYFPNRSADEYGPKKEPAYRGVRQPVLDHLVEAYDLIGGAKYSDTVGQDLIHCQRCFVSEIQNVLDPKSREKVLSRVLLDFGDVERLKMLGTK